MACLRSSGLRVFSATDLDLSLLELEGVGSDLEVRKVLTEMGSVLEGHVCVRVWVELVGVRSDPEGRLVELAEVRTVLEGLV